VTILLLDNYDSYTFNLYQLIAAISGTPPLVVRHDQLSWTQLRQLELDAVVISPGPGHPANLGDFGLGLRVLRELERPILGVCLGHQGMAVAAGGQVVHAPAVCHGQQSAVYHDGTDLFAGIPSPFTAVRYHSLLVDRASLPSQLAVTARTADGLIMGLRHRHRPQWGVQFHPESICTDHGATLIKNFLTLAGVCPAPPPSATVVPPRQVPPTPNYRVSVRPLADWPDPEAVFVSLYGQQRPSFWLDSSQTGAGGGRFSFMGDGRGPHSLQVEYDSRDRTLTLTQGGHTRRQGGDLFTYLQHQLDQRRCPAPDLPCDFCGGFIGYFGYELKAHCQGWAVHGSAQPDGAFVLADRLLVFDHATRRLYLAALGLPADEAAIQTWFDATEAALQQILPLPPPPLGTGGSLAVGLSRSRSRYLRDIQHCLTHIHNGDSYELCLTNHLHTAATPDPLTVYRLLRRRNPAPYAAFLQYAWGAVACSSPERFLKIDPQGWVETKPIKGTRPRGATPAADRALAADLAHNPKDRAENLMVLDLLRNDLGQVCQVGTVHAPQIMAVETYATVHQLVSTVRGRLRAEVRIADCIRAAFPGGSMTGAPKRRTMALLDELETAARGVYSGALGWLGLGGGADLNIVIRTAVFTPTGTTIGSGGGIIALSDPEAEFEEMLLKARPVLAALAEAAAGSPTAYHLQLEEPSTIEPTPNIT